MFGSPRRIIGNVAAQCRAGVFEAVEGIVMRKALAGALFGFVIAVAVPANAYTLVLKSGERVDIGDAYRLEGSRLTYADGQRVQHYELATLDLEATARANRETVASFVARASRTSAPSVAAAPARTEEQTPLTVTNADLEPLRIERERLDAEYYARNPDAVRTASAPPTYAARQPYETSLGAEDLERWRAGFLALQDRVDAQQAQIDAIRSNLAVRGDRPFKYGLSYRYNFGARAPIAIRNGQFYSLQNPPYPYLRADEEFSQLNSRLIDLEIEQQATRLERDRYVERGRRAGVPPGWLRE